MWKYYISTDKDFITNVDISSLCNMSQTSLTFARCTTAFKSVTTSCSFVIRNGNSTLFNTAISYILSAWNNQSDVHFRIVDNNSTLFRGKLTSDTFTLTSKKVSGDVTLKAKDYTTELDKKEGYNENYENTSINNLVKYLLKDAGFGYEKASYPFVSTKQYYTYSSTEKTYTLVTSPEEAQLSNYYEWSTPIYSSSLSDTKVKEYYLISEDENKTYRQKIDTLLLEAAGYVLHYRHSDGKFEIIQSIVTTGTARTLNYKLSEGLSSSIKPYEYDGVQVTWDTMTEKSECNIYAEDVGLEQNDDTSEWPYTEWKGTKVAKMIGTQHAYFPDTGYTENVYQTFRIADRDYELKISGTQNEDLKFYYAKPSTCVLEVKTACGTPNKNGTTWETYESGDVKVSPNPEFYPTKMQFLLWNKSATEDLDLQQLSVSGTAVYRTKVNDIVIPNKLINPDKYESSIYNKTDADAFAKWYYNARKLGGNTTTWYEVEGSNVMSALGDVVTVNHDGVNMGQNYSVIQIENQSLTGTIRKYKVTAVAISAWSESLNLHSSSTGTGSITTRNTVITYGLSDSQTEQPTTWAKTYTYTTGKWLWTRTATVQSTGQITYSYSQMYMTEAVTPLIQYAIGSSDTTYPVSYNLGVGSETYLGIGTDTMFGADAWADTVPTSVPSGYYVWMRISKDNGTTWQYSRLTGKEGASAYLFKLSCNKGNLTRDDRSVLASGATTNDSITITATIENYTWTDIYWYVDEATSNPTITTNPYREYTYSYNQRGETAHRFIAKLRNGTEVLETAIFALPVIDITTKAKFLGAVESLPVESAYSFIVGDYFVVKTEFTSGGTTYTAGTAWEITAISDARVITWSEMTNINNAPQLLTCLNGLRKSLTDEEFNSLSKNASGISWFNTIVAAQVIANEMFTNSLTMGEKGVIKSYKYGESDGQGGTIGGYKLYFSEDGNIGVIKADKLIADKSSEFHGKVKTDYFETNDSIENTYTVNAFNSSTATQYAKESEWLAQVATYVYNNGDSGESAKWLDCTGSYHGRNFDTIYYYYGGSGIYTASFWGTSNSLEIRKTGSAEVYTTYTNTFTHSGTSYISSKEYWNTDALYDVLTGNSTLAVGQSVKLSSSIQIDTQTYTYPTLKANYGSVSIINGSTEIATIASSGKRNGAVYLSQQSAIADSTNGISVTNIIPLDKTSSSDTYTIGTSQNPFDTIYTKITTKTGTIGSESTTTPSVRTGASVIETWHNSTEWYRIWSDNWVEQGGQATAGSTPISLVKTYSSTDYIAEVSINNTASATYNYFPYIINKSSSSFQISCNISVPCAWYACGYLGSTT